MWWKSKSKRIYLDTAAATPVSDSVLAAMAPYQQEIYGNASAIHQEGQAARSAIETARTKLARCLHVRPEGITFTGSGTESNNLAIYGLVRRLVESGTAFTDLEIISTKIEHPSVIEVLKHLESHGVRVQWCPVDEEGRINVATFKTLLSKKTALVTFAYVNSEVGTIQPIRKIVRVIEAFNRECGTNIKTHLDAAQAPLWLSCELDRLGVDLLSLDAGKCYGPKGVGVLARRHGVELKPILLGGGQETGLRASTENVAGIVGATTAIIEAQANYQARSEAVSKVRDIFIEKLEELPEVVLNGPRTDRLANNINISIPGYDSEYAVVWLGEQGIACSTRSACSGADGSGSVVVKEMTDDQSRADSTIRFSLHKNTIEIDGTLVVEKLREYLALMKNTVQ